MNIVVVIYYPQTDINSYSLKWNKKQNQDNI